MSQEQIEIEQPQQAEDPDLTVMSRKPASQATEPGAEAEAEIWEEPAATGPLQCPKCQVEMDKVTFKEVVVDRCPRCQGIWFDLLEHEELRKLPGSESIDPGARSTAVSEEARQLDCPKCHTLMGITRDPQQSHLVYEKCSVCYGVFFDAGEFTDFKNLTLTEWVRSFFS